MAHEDPKLDEREDPKREEERLRARLQGVIPELFKRTFYAGLGAVFTTEEGIRKIVNDFSLPKDVANYLVSQAQGTKDEMFRLLAIELRGWLDKLNLHQELAKLLTTLSFEIKTEVRFIPNDQAVGQAAQGGTLALKPEVKQKVAIRRGKRERVAPAPAQPARDDDPDTSGGGQSAT
jgi:hypothetical protein